MQELLKSVWKGGILWSMKKVKINYTGLKAELLIALSENVQVKLPLNPMFASPPVTMANLKTQTDKTEAALVDAADRDRHKLAVLRKEKKVLSGMLRQTAEFVNTMVTDGNEVDLLSSGFDVYKTPEKYQLPGEIESISAKFTDLAGQIGLSWKRARHARYYEIFISEDNGQVWTMLDSIFGRKKMVENLVSGRRYQFKVVPVGLYGTGPVSDVASQVAA